MTLPLVDWCYERPEWREVAPKPSTILLREESNSKHFDLSVLNKQKELQTIIIKKPVRTHFMCNFRYTLSNTTQNRLMLWKTRTNRNSPEAMFHNIERSEHRGSGSSAHFTLSVSLSCSLRWAWIFNAQQFFSFFLVEGLFEHINWELTSLRLDTPFWYHFKTWV